MKNRRPYSIAIECLGIAVLLFLFCSCLSFSIGDWPSRYVYPYNSPPHNWCGKIGAFCAYHLLYYVGPGIFILLFTWICFLAAKMADKKIGQIVLRMIGLGLLTVAGSTTFYCLCPDSVYTFPMGSGGLLGVGAAYFLKSQFALLGTFLLILAMWLVGGILLADYVVVALLAGMSFGLRKVAGLFVPAWGIARERSAFLSEVWRKLSVKQQSQFQPAASSTPEISTETVTSAPLAKIETKPLEVKQPEKQPEIKKIQVTASAPAEVKLPALKPIERPKPVSEDYKNYILPPMELLDEPEYGYIAIQSKVVKSKATTLEQLLSEFNINARVVATETGPVVTMFELELAAGVKVSQISSLANDIARALGAGAVRVVAPMPGKHTIGIEAPNNEKEKVRIKDLMQLAGDKPSKMHIPLFLGKDSSGEALVSDLTAMPHLLIAGTTGSGKSVCISSIIASILLTRRPDEVKMILVDPKMVEMTTFNTVPHLMTPIVTETQRAVQILEWATVKMDERYALMAEARVKNISGYNSLTPQEIIERFEPETPEEEAQIPKRLPYIMIIIDELADLMMTAAKEIEGYIVRLAQKSRAVGIHLVLATQRPQATVVTGLIKSNMPTRIGFRVAARMDSRIILDQNGAETLLGQGDMLFLKPGTSDLIRAQGTFLDEAEVKRIVKHLKDIAEPQFHQELMQLGRVDAADVPRDEMFDGAVRVVLESHRGSVSLLQRRLGIGYGRASRMIEMMEAAGILGEYKGSQAREVLMTLEEYEQLRSNMEKDSQDGYADMQEDHEAAPESDDETADEVSQDEDHPISSSSPNYLSRGQQDYVSTDGEN